MKRLIALLLCLSLLTCLLAACGKNDPAGDTPTSSANTTSTVKIKTDLKNGNIPELPLTLGCSVDGARATLNALEALPEGVTVDPDYTYYSTKVSGDTVRLSCEGNFYYYNESKSQQGISAMVTFSDAFGFKIGIEMLSDIVNAIPQKGTTYSPTADDLYFIFGDPELEKYQAIYFTEGNIRVDFIFYDSYLAATVIWNTDNWNPADAK